VKRGGNWNNNANNCRVANRNNNNPGNSNNNIGFRILNTDNDRMISFKDEVRYRGYVQVFIRLWQQTKNFKQFPVSRFSRKQGIFFIMIWHDKYIIIEYIKKQQDHNKERDFRSEYKK